MGTSAFDEQAAGYDDVATSALGVELRRRVRLVLLELINTAEVVVDLGCGSGLDAEWFAPQVTTVIAADPSAEMISIARQRCAQYPNVSLHHAPAESFTPLVGQTGESGAVDLVLANFGVVNCVGDLAAFGQHLQSMLRPGGHAVLVTMPVWCPIELAIGAATANAGLLKRRRQTTSEDYPGLHLTYASAHDLADMVGPGLQLVHAEALGVVLPPFEQRSRLQARPRLLKALASADEKLGGIGARLGIGDHHIAVFRAQP